MIQDISENILLDKGTNCDRQFLYAVRIRDKEMDKQEFTLTTNNSDIL